ncbi:MAG: hypothetical protein ACI9WU_005321 [Myxococcota bacterium]
MPCGVAQFPLITPWDELRPARFFWEAFAPAGRAAVGEALGRAWQHFSNRPATGKARHVLLVTDGVEECDGQALGMIKQLRAIGVDVWVLGFEGVNDAGLSALAQAGGHPREHSTRKFHPLGDGFHTVMEQVTASYESTEVCDSIDNDCNGEVDENLWRRCDQSC